MAAPNLVETHVDPDLEQMKQNEVERRARITRPRWNPQEWHPVYEEVVLLDCMGYKRSEIALEKGFTEMHITNILKTEQAKVIRRLVEARLQKKFLGTVEDRLEKVSMKALQRVEDVINDDVLASKKPMEVFDRALSILKGTSKIKGDGDTTNIQKAIIVPEHQLKQLMEGMAFADRAREIHAPKQEIVIESSDVSTS